MKKLFKITFVILSSLPFMLLAQSHTFWTANQVNRESVISQHGWAPTNYLGLSLDLPAIKNLLLTAPDFQTAGAVPVNVELPMPDGTFETFRIFEIPVMHPDLQAKFPGIRTFGGNGLEHPLWSVRCDFTQFGFHGFILTEKGAVYIDPLSLINTNDYLIYYKHLSGQQPKMVCELAEGSLINAIEKNNQPNQANKSTTNQLRTYRLAVAATGEYTAFFGGTVAAGQAAIVTSINRVDGIYMREVDVHLQLVPNNNLLVYTNAATDPYTNGSGGTMLGQNQTNITTVIGTANFDIGHVFSTGGGGVAGLGVVCSASNKARGVTGSGAPVGDPFDVDYVAHEMGHQFAGNHTFNSVTGACNGNRSASHAYEVGSGITIQAYAGICGSDDLAPNSIAYFHTHSFDEIYNFTTTGGGNSCPVITNPPNQAPVIDNITDTSYIPFLTAFKLSATGHDPDVEPIDYSWEQFDLGPAGAWNAPSGNAPIYRSNIPSASGERIFPKLSNILNNTISVGEIYPTYARDMKFRVTLRDEKNTGGGVTYNDTAVIIHVVNTSGPFEVSSPNTAVSYAEGSTQTITWNVNNTTAAPVSCANVKISLSTDGGLTFPTVLSASTANDGSELVTIPYGTTITARIMVEAVGNIFFDISNTNFSITPNPVISGSLSFCAGGNTILSTGTYSGYLWSTGATTQTISVSTAGTYTVTATDAGANTGSASVTTTVNPLPTPSIIGNLAICTGGSTTLDAGAFAGYNWSTGATTQTITVNTAGTFMVTVTDGNGCIGSTSVTTTIIACCNISLSGNVNHVICTSANSGSIDVTSSNVFGTPVYLWDDGTTTEDRSSLTAGTYTVTVTYGVGCSQSQGFTVNPVVALAASGTSSNVTCKATNTGSITLSPSGGTSPYTFLWNNGSTVQNRSSLAAGTYTVTVSDVNLCTTSSTFVVTQPATVLIINTNKTNVRCFASLTGSITASGAGGVAPYSYLWNTIPIKTTATISGLAAGVYSCTVTDANNCTKTVVITITQPTLLNVVPSQTNVTAFGGNDGAASVSVSGGTPGYTYSWTTVPVKTTATVTGLTAGTYKCTVSDSKNCVKKLLFTITQPAPKMATANLSSSTLFISPNPTNGNFKVAINQSVKSNYFYVIEDVSGKLILKHNGYAEAGQQEINIDLTGMAKGVYFMKWFDDNRSIVKRIVLQ